MTAERYRPTLFTSSALTALIIPLIIEQALAISVGMIDTVMISSLGEAAVSSVSLVDMVNVLIINLFSALATGGAVIAAQHLGAREKEDARFAAKQFLVVTALISLVVTAVCLVAKRPLLRLFFGEVEEEVMTGCLTYFQITALSFPCIAVYNGCAALFRAMGNSRISMLSSMMSNGINMAGNALLIYVVRWGIAGAALATLFARFCAMLLVLVLIGNPKNDIYIKWKEKFRFHLPTVGKILTIGIPSSIENCLFQLGRTLVVSIISGFGTVQIAANAVANTLDGMSVIAGSAMGLAMITVVGQCVGARDLRQTKWYIRRLMVITYLVHWALDIPLLILLPHLIGFFNLSAEAAALARVLVWIHVGFGLLVWPLSFTLPNAFRAAGDVRFTMLVSVLSMAIFRISLSYVLGVVLEMGAVGVWIGMCVDWICRVGLFLWRYLSGRWMGHANFTEMQ